MIYWLHDFRFSEYKAGGAQIDNEHMLKEAPFPVEMVHPSAARALPTVPVDRAKLNGHLLILSNTGLFRRSDLAWIVETQRYIKYERDYSFCKHRHATGHDCSVDCRETLQFYTRLFQRSLFNLFASPLQAGVYLKYMPLDKGKIDHIPSPIDVDRFSYTGPKEEMYLAVGEDVWHKGIDLVKKEFRGKNLVFIGGANPVPYDEIHKWYHRAKYFVHKPRWIDACPRTVGEALCANCILILNENIGWLSYPWWGDKKVAMSKMRESPKRFWEIIGNFYED